MPRASLPSRSTPPQLGVLVFLLSRVRWQSVVRRFRVHGRVGWLVPLVALLTPLSYVGIVTQALAQLAAERVRDADTLAVSAMAVTLLAASFTNRLAAGLSLLATTPENELVLARPVSLGRLAVARVITQTLADPVGGLFLLPLWTAPILVWRLPLHAFVGSVLVSLLLQISVVAAAQLFDVLLARLVPRRGRDMLAVGLRILATGCLAALWIAASQILREPASFARHAAALRPLLGEGPGAWPAAHLVALRRGAGVTEAAVAIIRLACLAAALLGAVGWLASRLARDGWEEPAASWAMPPPREPRTVLTSWRRELRLLARDRGRLTLIALVPVAFVGVPLLTSSGWAWTSARPERLTILVFSLIVYLAASGPLLHMQGEQRAFWIMLTVPVSLSRLLATKAMTWAALLVALALPACLVLGAAAPGSSVVSLETGSNLALLFVGTVGVAFLAVGMGMSAVDLAEPGRPAVGPGGFYAFLFVASLFNVVLMGPAPIAARGLLLYVVAVASVWHTGVADLRLAHDMGARGRHQPRARDAALFLLAAFLLPLGVGRLPPHLGVRVELAVDVLLVAAGTRLLVRWGRSGPVLRSWIWSLLLGVAMWLLARSFAPRVPAFEALGWARVVLREVTHRGIVQGAVASLLWRGEERGPRTGPGWAPAVAGILAGLVSDLVVTGAIHGDLSLVLALVAALARAFTGRISAALAVGCGWLLGTQIL